MEESKKYLCQVIFGALFFIGGLLCLISCTSKQLYVERKPVSPGKVDEVIAEEPIQKETPKEPVKPGERKLKVFVSGAATELQTAEVKERMEKTDSEQIDKRENLKLEVEAFEAESKLPEEEYVTLNFDQADLGIVLKTVGDIIGMNFILGPGVGGKVTVQTATKIPMSSLFDVLLSILQINGHTAVKSGEFYKIVPISTAIGHPLPIDFGKDIGLPPGDRLITRLIPLQHIPVLDMSRILQRLMSKGGNVISHKETNMLIINEFASNLERLLKIIDAVDVPFFQEREEIFVYFVENGKAVKIADIVNKLYAKRKSTAKVAPVPVAQRVTGKKPVEVPGPSIEEIAEQMSIVADETLNALIIRTTPRIYTALEKTIKALDIMPRQVLIEVLIAEISLNRDRELGIEWAYQNDIERHGNTIPYQVGQNVGLGTNLNAVDDSGNRILVPSVVEGAAGQGLNYLISETNKFIGMLHAVAETADLDVLSSPHILASENKEAVISIVEEVPIRKTDIVDNVTRESVEYRDAGIKLRVSPHINEKGLVTMDVDQEVSQVTGVDARGEFTFLRRTASTSVVVQDGQTLVIGGLITETKDFTRIGIPLLCEIPVLGNLFGYTTSSTEKRELILMITPHVIGDMADAERISKEFEDKVRGLDERLE